MIGHEALALGLPDRLAQIRFRMQAELAAAALRRIEGNDVVTGGHAGHPRSDFDHNAGALMAQDRREGPLRIVPGQGEGVRMADAGGLQLDEHLSGLRAL